MFGLWGVLSIQRLLIGIKDAEDDDGVGGFIDRKGDEVREALHGLAADVPIPDSGGGGQFSASPFNPTGRGTRMPGRPPQKGKLITDFGIQPQPVTPPPPTPSVQPPPSTPPPLPPPPTTPPNNG